MDKGKIERNDLCPCCSGEKFKNCCSGLRPPKTGTLRHAYDFGAANQHMNRIFFQILNIRDKVYEDDSEGRFSFDEKHGAVFQNMYEAMLSKQKFEQIVAEHREKIQNGVGCSYSPENGSITISESVDNEINMAFKDFFIRGEIAISGVISLVNFMGYKIHFLFGNEKDFQKQSKKFLEIYNTPKFRQFIKAMESNRKNWYETFNDIRNKIEHHGFKVPQVTYGLTVDDKISPLYFTIENLNAIQVLEVCWENMFNMCEEMIVFFLALKLESPYVIREIPAEKRDKAMPIRFQVGIDFSKFNPT